jgi:integrase
VAIIPVTHVTGLVETDPVLIVDWDLPLGDDGIYVAVRKAGERCELSLAPHDMRRSFAGILEDDGIPVTDIQRAMRHTNVGITSGYLEQNPRRAAAVTKGLTIDY